jgi:hypothetical protein
VLKLDREYLMGLYRYSEFLYCSLKMNRSFLELCFGLMKKKPVGLSVVIANLRSSRLHAIFQRLGEKLVGRAGRGMM